MQLAYVWLRLVKTVAPFVSIGILVFIIALLLDAADVMLWQKLLAYLISFVFFGLTLLTPWLPVTMWAVQDDYLYALYNGRGHILEFRRGSSHIAAARTTPSQVLRELGPLHPYPAEFRYQNISGAGNIVSVPRLFFEQVTVRLYWTFDPTRSPADNPAFALRELFDNPFAVEANLREPIRNAIREVAEQHPLDELLSSRDGLRSIAHAILYRVNLLRNGIYVDPLQLSIEVVLPEALAGSYSELYIDANRRRMFENRVRTVKQYVINDADLEVMGFMTDMKPPAQKKQTKTIKQVPPPPPNASLGPGSPQYHGEYAPPPKAHTISRNKSQVEDDITH